MQGSDAPDLEASFASMGWSKPRSQFDRYLEEQASGERWTCVAEIDGAPVGYVTVVWSSDDPFFKSRSIPEIVDLNVLPGFRERGVASAMLDSAEEVVAETGRVVGLGVGLHPGYGAAQRLYVRRGYLPDGSGALANGEQISEGATIVLDDEVTLRMLKRLDHATEGSYLGMLRDAIGHQLLLVPAVAIVVHDERGRLLMVQDRSTAQWSIPAGAIELGEDPEAAAERELFEETGVRGSALTLVAGVGGKRFRHTYPNGDRVEYSILVYATSVEHYGIPSDVDEIGCVEWFDRDAAPPVRLPYPRAILWPGAR